MHEKIRDFDRKKQKKTKFSQKIYVKKFFYTLFCTTVLLNLMFISICFGILFGFWVGILTIIAGVFPSLLGILRLRRDLEEYFEVT